MYQKVLKQWIQLHRPSLDFANMSEKFLTCIISLLNRAQPDGLTFDALTFHLYNSEQDFFGERPEMRTITTRLRSILDAYSTHIVTDERGAYHLRKNIPQQLTINFDTPQEAAAPEIIINTLSEQDYGEQLLFDLFDHPEVSQEQSNESPTPPPYTYPTLFDDDPTFVWIIAT